MQIVIDGDRATVTSRSTGALYPMLRTPSGWYHANVGCPWNYQRRDNDHACEHINELNRRTGMTTAVTERRGPTNLPTLIEDFDTALIVRGVEPEIVEKWAYRFRMAGKMTEGLSVLGVQAAVRWSAKNGEPIQTIDCHIEFEDEREARFVATAVRYGIVVNKDTGEIQRAELDRTIRAKRQSKWGLRADSREEYFNDNWYEIGYAKACRNVENALLTDQAKSAIVSESRKAAAELENQHRGAGRAAPASQEQRPPTTPAAVQRNEMVNDIVAKLQELHQRFPDVHGQVLLALKSNYPRAFDREGRFSATKLEVNRELPTAHGIVKLRLEQANGGPGPEATAAQVPLDPTDAPVEAKPDVCVECGEPVAVYDAEGNGFCQEHSKADT